MTATDLKPAPSSGRELPTTPPPVGWIRRIAGQCWRHRGDVLWAFGAAVIGSTIAAVTPLVTRHVVDEVVTSPTASIWPWAVLLMLAGVVRYAAGYTRRYRAGRLSLDVQLDLRTRVMTSLQQLDGPRQDALQTGQVVSRSISDLNLVQGLLAFLPNLTGNALLFVVSLLIMLWLSPLLTLIALAIGPAIWLVAYFSRKQLFPANWDAQNEAGVLAGQVEGAVTGVRVVKGFGQEQRELGRLEDRARSLFASRMRVVRLNSRWNPMLQAIPALGQVAVIAFGGLLALNGSITLGTFLAFSTYLGQLVSPVRQLAALLTIGQQARAGVERVMEIIDERPDIVDPRQPVALPAGPIGLELAGVSFGYDEDRDVLRDLSLHIEPGETVAIIGSSGSGKSTIGQLAARFYDVSSGRVSVGGIDVRDVRLEDLRRRVNVVFEEAFLFSDTLRANLTYSHPHATQGEVQAVIAAAALDFIDELPDGLDTVVGEQGLTLSGGQRQRVALARALLAAPDLLILDDTTSAVDSQTEARIHDALEADNRVRTMILIAHRRSTLNLADRVAVLHDGAVVDIGSVAVLEQRCALFRELISGEETVQPLDASVVPVEQVHEGVTPSLWRRSADIAPQGLAAEQYRQTAAAAGIGAPRGGSMLSSQAATPELLALVGALPPAHDTPDVDSEGARAPDPRFTLQHLLRPLRVPLVIGLALVALDALAQTVLPSLVRHAVDSGVSASATGILLGTAGVALLVVIADWLVNIGQSRITGRTGERLLYTLRVKTFAHLQRLGLDYYERELGGRIMTRMTTDVDALSSFLQTGLATAIVSLLSIVGVLIAMLLLDAGLAVTVGALVPLLLVATWWFRRKSVPLYTEARERVSRVNASFQESVAGMRVTQAFVREDRDANSFAVLARSYRDSRLSAQRWIARYFPFIEFLSEIAVALVLLVGATRVRDGSLSVGALIAFLLYVDLFFSPMQQLSQVFDSYQQAAVGLRRLAELLRTPTSTPPAADPMTVNKFTGELELDRLGFGYGADAPEVLHNLTVQIPAGQQVALVGATGAGKSSVIKLLARFYDPIAGRVAADGHDLRDLDLMAYRHRLGYVPQEAYLFAGTVSDAIAYGRPDASPAEVEAAAREVGAHAMIADLRDGYLHQVGERGRALSAGQRQLIALARAQLVDPDILLLDEATAALDLSTEREVNAASQRLARARTTIVVAHRLQTAARSERILVMDHGRIIEDGSHQELLAANGAYRKLWDTYGGHRVTL